MALSVERILEGLTEPQREAAMHVDGPLLVLAGAGSGKTRTITRRIAYLVANGIPAWQILAITFTNKAAGEMRERVDTLLKDAGRMGRGVTVCTFHSLCARLLREYADKVGLPTSYSIFDSSDQAKTVKQAIKDVSLSVDNFQPNAVLSAISGAKNKLQTPAAYGQAAGGFYEKNVARIYARYEQILTENKAVDFDDLLLKVAILLRDDKQARETLQERYQYIMIDEYQDTNHAQFIIAHMLAMDHKNICATGDPDQSIYGWRGANIQNILEFEQFYPNAKVVLLEQNYRSTKVILQAASALIANNTKRKKKDLWTENEEGPRIQQLRCNDEHHEASEVVRRIKLMRDKEGLRWDDMAIFYRVNSLSRVLEDALMKAGVPYQIARGTEFYARKEIKDLLAYLRVISNPDDGVSLERIINVPTRGLGDTSVAKIAMWGGREGMTLLQACGVSDQIEGLTTRAVNASKKVAAMFAAWRKELNSGVGAQSSESEEEGETQTDEAGDFGSDPLFEQSLAEEGGDAEMLAAADEEYSAGQGEEGFSEPVPQGIFPGGIRLLLERVIRESGLEADYKKQDLGEDGGTDRLANAAELVNVAAEFDAQNPEGTLSDFLQQVTLVSDTDRLKDAGGSVTLMTLHAAKGLEFPFVAMVGVEDGMIPHARAIGFSTNPDEMEEERRLAFVGITRAMKHLVMSYARYRMVRGLTERTIKSQFFGEIPDECFEEIDLTTEENEGYGSVGYRDEASYGRQAQRSREDSRGYEAASQRREVERMSGEFKRGMLVRHPAFGLGRIEDISPAGSSAVRVVVKFQMVGEKKLIMPPAPLERVDA